MAYPALYQRLFNFARDKNNGLESPDASKLDIELDAIQVAVSMLRDRVKAITSADGRLRNVASPLAAALVGTWSGTTSGVADYTTTIPWQAAFSVNSVLVLVGSTLYRPGALASVQDDGGFLEVSFPIATGSGDPITVWAFEPGAGILTQLASTATGEGASLIGIEDALGIIDADNVEDALAELAAEAAAFVTAVGDLDLYFKVDGSRVATANWDLNGFKITNAADGVDDGDFVTVRQVAAYVATWSDLQRFYMKRDGTTAMAGNLNFGNNKGINLADPDLNQPLDAVNVRAMLRAISVSGAAPVGVVLPFAGSTPPSADWLIADGSAYADTAYPVLSELLSGAYKPPGLPAQGCITPQFPALVSGDITAGAITTLPSPVVVGAGYEHIPQIVVENTDGGAAVVTQPTFTVSVSPVVTDGPNVTGGEPTITLATGGAGVRAGAIIKVNPVRAAAPTLPAFAQLPSGYFRVPDMRGRVALGAGTESKTPGITDPPAQAKGDAYDATTHTVGEQGGEEKHRLTVAELARHNHGVFASGPAHRQRASGSGAFAGSGSFVGNDEAHNTLPPYHVLNYIIKAQ